MCFAAFAWLGTSIAHIALGVLALMTIAQGPAVWRRLACDPFVRLFFAFLVFLLGSAALTAHRLPEFAHDQWSSIWPWCGLWAFFIIAWWLQGSWARVTAVVLLAPAGLMISVLRRTDWRNLPAWLEGARYEFGFTSLGLSFLCVVAVLALTATLPRLGRLRGKKALAAGCSFAAALLFFLSVLLIAQSRGAWLSLTVGFIVLAVGGRWAKRRDPTAARLPARVWLAMLLFLAAIGGLLATYGGTLGARFTSEADALPALIDLDVDRLPYSSGPARLHLAAWGLRLLKERPLFGWGPGTEATRYLAQNGFHGDRSGFLRVVRHFAHLHNVYAELLVRFGLFGAGFFIAALALLLGALRASWMRGDIPNDFFVGTLAIMAATLFSGFYEFRWLHTDFRFFMLIFGGVSYTWALHAGSGGHGRPRSGEMTFQTARGTCPK